MSSLWFTAAASLLCVVVWILWRVWPVLAGGARPGDPRAVRLLKWNRHLLKLLRKTLGDQLPVAQVGFFQSTRDGQEHSLATWALRPTLIPDVEFLLLARPDTGEVAAAAPARELRALLGDAVQRHAMWGHEAWIYDWPGEVELEAVIDRLTPIAAFRAQHGLTAAEGAADATAPAAAGSSAASVGPASVGAERAPNRAERRRSR